MLVVVWSFFGYQAMAQQEAMNAQFILNTMVINPGYTGYNEVQSITADHRSQWVGFRGAPTTNSIGFDMVIPERKEIAFGGNLIHDQIGPTSELSLSGNIAYRVTVSPNSQLSIGLKGFAGLFQASYTRLDLTSEIFGQEDVNFSYNPSNVLLVNFGAGAYHHSEKHFIGISSPRLLKNKIENEYQNVYSMVRGRTAPTYYLMGGYNFSLSAWTDLQPALLVKATEGAPLSIGLYGSVLLKRKWRIGAFYNYREVAGALIQLQVNDKIRAGYSFDVAATEFISTNLGSHELSLTYQFKKFSKRIVFPRRF